DIWHCVEHVPGTQTFIDVSPIYEPHGTGRNRAMKNKIVSAAEAVAIIRDGDTIACSGFVGSGTPDELIVALEQRFVETGSPRDLTLVFAAGPGDGKERGLNRLARMVRYMETHYHT